MNPLTPQGTFDVTAAQALECAVAQIPRSHVAAVDFSHVREFHAFALAAFADWVSRSRRRVIARGLRDHELRILRYMGFGAWLLGDYGAGEARAAEAA